MANIKIVYNGLPHALNINFALTFHLSLQKAPVPTTRRLGMIDFCYATGTFGVAKSALFPYHICNYSGFLPTEYNGTIVSVFGDQYYPQDVVLPFDPTFKT